MFNNVTIARCCAARQADLDLDSPCVQKVIALLKDPPQLLVDDEASSFVEFQGACKSACRNNILSRYVFEPTVTEGPLYQVARFAALFFQDSAAVDTAFDLSNLAELSKDTLSWESVESGIKFLTYYTLHLLPVIGDGLPLDIDFPSGASPAQTVKVPIELVIGMEHVAVSIVLSLRRPTDFVDSRLGCGWGWGSEWGRLSTVIG